MSKRRRAACRVIVAVCLAACCGCSVRAALAYESDEALAERIEAAGRGAHLGRALCGVTAAKVADYKERLRHSLAEPPEFDTRWDYGWKRAEPILLQYRSLREGDPQDYTSRVRLVCATLHSMAKRLPERPTRDAPPPQ
jgi:hypothetical protein